MEFEGLKVKTNVPVQAMSAAQSAHQAAQTKEAAKKGSDSANFADEDTVISGAIGKDMLGKVKELNEGAREEVIYGVYDNKDKGIFTRMNDFFVDRSKVSLKDKSYFFHMLAVMVDAGIPVVQAVKSLAVRTRNERFRRVLMTVSYNCERGATLANAMMRFDDIFDESEIGIVRSGEVTGKLNSMLFKLSDQLDKSHELSMKLWGAAVYPIVVLVVLTLVAGGMLVWVFPTLLNLLNEGGITGGALPLPTRILIALQRVVANYWWAVGLGIVALYAILSMYISTNYGAVRWDYFKLKMPLIGSLMRKIYTLRFVSLLGILIESGLPVIKSLQIVGNSLKNRIYKLKMQELIDGVKKGEKISMNLRDSEFLFSPEVADMLQTGEASASLGHISVKISDQYEKEIDSSLKKLTSVFEPVMILTVGLFVGLLALAIMSPIFNLNSIAGV